MIATLSPPLLEHDRLQRHARRCSIEFARQGIPQRFDDPLWIDAAARPDLGDEWRAVDQRPREGGDVGDDLFAAQRFDTDLAKAGLVQSVLYRINALTAVRRLEKARRSDGKKAAAIPVA